MIGARAIVPRQVLNESRVLTIRA